MIKKLGGISRVLPSTLKAPFIVREMIQSPRLKPIELRELQNKKLSAIIKHSYDHVPYYHSLFKRAKIRPDDIRTIEDLNKIPTTEKNDLRHLPLEKVVAGNIDVTRCYRHTTSGTTGIPLFIYWTVDAKLVCDLQHLRWKSECGVRPVDREVSIGVDYLLDPLKRLMGFANGIHPSDDLHAQIKQIQRFKPKVLLAYPSCLKILAKEIKERKVQGIDVKILFTSGEMLDNYTRELLREVFDADVFDGYGIMEVGGICCECVEHTGYHIWAESVIVQIARGGESVSTGEEGEIVVTDLANYAMPFIRYKLDDSGVLIEDKSSCGSSLPLMKVTSGRNPNVTLLQGNVLIPSVNLVDFLNPIPGIKQFQVVQEEIDHFRIKIVKNRRFGNSTVKEIKQGLLAIIRRRINQKDLTMKIDVLTVDHIPRAKSGKFDYFITKIIPSPM
ncbi:MAG: phenylacetate--CoA ligase family protein [Candidatus Bathyarchaeota archaeon]|nr:MAG: phenylacetate--CoA ligase family protein [Candidatus Bathyarchaeota archaeon]